MKSVLKNKYFWIIFFITILGIFLRSYQHKDLLFFEVDQARDWRIVEIAVQNGPGELPLLGPGMNSSRFRIGPIYQYIQYATALIFGNSPNAIAYPDLLFSIASIPLFYFYLLEFFKKRLSAILTLLYSISLFSIEYSRFAMNSNSIPFFLLVLFLSFLKLGKEKTNKWVWIITGSLSLGIVIQLHALTLLVIPIITLAYFILSKTKLKKKQLLAGVGIILVLNLPMICSESLSGFKNTQAFFEGLNNRKTRYIFSPAKKTIKNTQEMVRSYAFALVSHNWIKSLDPEMQNEGATHLISKNLTDNSRRFNLAISIIISFLLFFPCLWLIKEKFWKKDKNRKNFLILFFLYQFIFLLVYINSIYVQHVRYFLPVILIPFIILGFYLEKAEKTKSGPYILSLFTTILILTNLSGIRDWFSMVKSYKDPAIYKGNSREYVLDPYFIVTYNQIEAASTYIEKAYQESGKGVFLESPDTFYVRSVRYPLEYGKHIPMKNFRNSLRDKNKLYFFIASIGYPPKSIPRFPKIDYDNFEINDFKSFGTLVVYSFKPKDYLPDIPANIDNSKSSSSDEHLTDKSSWNQFFKSLKEANKKK